MVQVQGPDQYHYPTHPMAICATYKLDSRLAELLAVQASELVGPAVDPMTRAPAAGAFKVNFV